MLYEYFQPWVSSSGCLSLNLVRIGVDTEEAGRIEIEAAGKRLFVGER
jgi:hypothetical protein